MSTSSSSVRAHPTCPDCGTHLNPKIPGFRAATDQELARLDINTVRLLRLCPNTSCPGRKLARGTRSA